MTLSAKLESRYNFERPYISRAADIVRDIVSAYCDANGFAYSGRLKSLSSLEDKLEGGRYGSWQKLDDLFGCTIVTPGFAYESDTVAFLQHTFEQVELRERGGTRKDPMVFRFDATRFYGRLTAKQAPDENTRLRGITFEVQIRTVFEHAWSVTTHAPAYKAGTVDWKRMRLAAQLKAAVEQLDVIVAAYDSAVVGIPESKWPEVSAKISIEKFFRPYFLNGKLSPLHEPSSWVRFTENLYAAVVNSREKFVRPGELESVIGQALEVIRTELDGAEFVAPLSVSMMQLCLGIWTKLGFIVKPIKNYVPVISDELLSLYPSVSVLGSGFDFAEPFPASDLS